MSPYTWENSQIVLPSASALQAGSVGPVTRVMLTDPSPHSTVMFTGSPSGSVKFRRTTAVELNRNVLSVATVPFVLKTVTPKTTGGRLKDSMKTGLVATGGAVPSDTVIVRLYGHARDRFVSHTLALA